MTTDPLKQLIAAITAETGCEKIPSGYDLRDPVISRELLDQPVAHFKLSPPETIQTYLDGLGRPATATEEEIVCDFLDRIFDLAPRFCTVMDLNTREIWVTQTEEETRRRQHEQRNRPASETPKTTYDLHQLHGLENRIQKGNKKRHG
ncbi:MAG: hypothetical protein LBK99_16510 [Opitutaceae bacterium]|jgi:hypothetical protein|nr:hypothetical protein [Opitutaceae bacterium]